MCEESYIRSALLAFNLPNKCDFPWHLLSPKKLEQVEEWLNDTSTYYEWVDHLVIGVYRGELSVTEALILATCSTKELQQHGLNKDGAEFDAIEFHSGLCKLHKPQYANKAYNPPAETTFSFSSSRGLPITPSTSFSCAQPVTPPTKLTTFCLVDVRRDWWLSILDPITWHSNTSQYDKGQAVIRNHVKHPLTRTDIQKLGTAIESKSVTLFTALIALASLQRHGHVLDDLEKFCLVDPGTAPRAKRIHQSH